ncbi:MAG TPA: hypothetical protein VK021_12645 [Flavobacteriaceae bacterium]|nr:hypothetical protein [Flavobacteriaceae bacterium]
MKKQVIITVLALGAILFGTMNAQAQDLGTEISTEVRLILEDVISFKTGSIAHGGQVDFTYSTAADYNSTKTANVPSSLIVTSTKSFEIKAKANGENFTDGTNNIPVDVVTIKPVMGGGTTTMEGTPNDIQLTTTDQTIINNADLGSMLVLDLDYEIPEARSSSSDILGKPAGTYTQTVTYTATAL